MFARNFNHAKIQEYKKTWKTNRSYHGRDHVLLQMLTRIQNTKQELPHNNRFISTTASDKIHHYLSGENGRDVFHSARNARRQASLSCCTG